MTPNLSALSIGDVLDRAAALLEPEGAWTQGAFARTGNGHAIGPSTEAAVCFCGVGAIYRAAGSSCSPLALRCVMLLAGTIRGANFAKYNDAPERTQAEVVAKLKEAASLAREQSA